MDTTLQYGSKIVAVLAAFADLVNRTTRYGQVDTVCLFDDIHANYMIYRIGWDEQSRIRLPLIFVRIVEDKVWVEENWTEIDLLQELTDAGIPPSEIFFGFLHPLERDSVRIAVA